MQQELAAGAVSGWLAVWKRFMVGYLRWCLLVGTPLLWFAGFMAYFGHSPENLFGRQVHDVPSLLIFLATAPLAIIVVGCVIWIVLVFPCQLLWLMIGSFKKR